MQKSLNFFFFKSNPFLKERTIENIRSWEILLFFLFLVFWDRVFLRSFGSCPGTHSVDEAPQTHRDLPASASQMRGLTMYTTTQQEIFLRKDEMWPKPQLFWKTLWRDWHRPSQDAEEDTGRALCSKATRLRYHLQKGATTGKRSWCALSAVQLGLER